MSIDKKMSSIEQMNFWGKSRKPFLFVFNFDLSEIVALTLEEAEAKGFLFDIQGFTNDKDATKTEINEEIVWSKYIISYEEYFIAFQKIKEGLHRGDSFLCNLTFQNEIKTNLDLKDIFRFSKAKYKLYKKNTFTCFSPEIFIRINSSGIISSYPMKGTIDATIPNAKELIINDMKEKAEHFTIVDLIRNDLSKVAKKVEVTRFRYIDYLNTNQKNLLQVSSEIQGQLPDNWNENIGNLLLELLPAGSITGAPKASTMNLIRNAETYERGFYTGIFGIFDGNSVDSGVMIRFVEKNGDKLYFKSGGGITVFSNPEKEYDELVKKIYLPI